MNMERKSNQEITSSVKLLHIIYEQDCKNHILLD